MIDKEARLFKLFNLEKQILFYSSIFYNMFKREDRINFIRQRHKEKIHYHIHQPQLPRALFASFMKKNTFLYSNCSF